MRYKIDLAYNGKNFHGWQRQENAHSVQAEIEEKLSLLLGVNTEITGCGRTDTGVHAKDFAAHFDSANLIDEKNILYKLNRMLPDSIAINNIQPVQAHFHARFDAIQREYQYYMHHSHDPFLVDFSWLFTRELDWELMNTCSQLLMGKHDFECFSKVHTEVNNFICEVYQASWTRSNNQLVFTISANRFLRNMVRAIVGTLVDVGLHKTSQGDFEAILKSKNRSEAGQSVPAHALFLTRVVYPDKS
jgi:tRNA pseudouridine38-40 synthase